MGWVIIFDANRVITTLTSADPAGRVPVDHSAVEIPGLTTIGTGYKKLNVDNVTIDPATDQEATDANINEEGVQERRTAKQSDLEAKLALVRDDGTAPRSVRDVAISWLDRFQN